MAERRLAALGDFTQSVRAWSNLAANGALASPKEWVGARLRFQDGTAPFVFRETVRRKASTDDPAVIVIQFRLTFLGSSPSRHAAFRRECILHTPLFAGFPGFRSKQWADDLRTGVYAGIYEWQGADLASTTPSALVGLLTPRDATEGHRPLRQRAYPPTGGERRAVLAGVVLGGDEGLDADLRDDFRASGLCHLLRVDQTSSTAGRTHVLWARLQVTMARATSGTRRSADGGLV